MNATTFSCRFVEIRVTLPVIYNSLGNAIMKKLMVPAFIALISFAINANAEENAPGNWHVAAKVAHISFTDSVLEHVGLDESVYYGIEAYAKAAPKFYVGGEVGYVNEKGAFSNASYVGTELTYIPIEVNIKYFIQDTGRLSFAIGGGVSQNYVEENTYYYGTYTWEEWLFGVQAFADLSYRFGDRYFAGVNAKFQLTEDMEDSSYGYDNIRLGAHVGVVF